MKNQNVIVDRNRTAEKITNISQLNHKDMYEVTILNLRSLELRFEKVEINGISEEIVTCHDSNEIEIEKDIQDSSEDNSLLSEHVLEVLEKSWSESDDENTQDMTIKEEE